MESKPEARRKAAEAERRCDEAYLRYADRVSFGRLFELDEYKNAGTVFCYVGIHREPNTVDILLNALESGKRAAVPKITGSGMMEARYISSLTELVPDRNGIPEPPEGSERAVLSAEDVIILPASAFSVKLERLGRGGGYYDRFLADSRGIRIGIGRERLLLDQLPTEPFDIPADILITEEKIRSRC